MGVLDGLHILDFSTLLPGPFATMKLADHGAEVLCIKAKDRPDILADLPPLLENSRVTAAAAWLGRNKRSMFLDLKKPKSIEAFHSLLSIYDILVEQFRPGVMDRLGLGYEALRQIHPRLIYCSISGYGQSGPLSQAAGHDINYLARSGNSYPTGRRSSGPALMNIQVADLAAGSLEAAFAILAAVYHRERTGQGQRIDVSLLDGLVPFNGMEGARCLTGGRIPPREGCPLNGGWTYDYYETSDGEYMAVGALEPKFSAALCQVLGHPEWSDHRVFMEQQPQIKEGFRRIFRTKTRREWEDVFRDTDCCVEPVRTVREAAADPQLTARGMFPQVLLPETGELLQQLGTPNSLPEHPVEYHHAGYPSGYHTYEVLEALGYTRQEIDAELI